MAAENYDDALGQLTDHGLCPGSLKTTGAIVRCPVADGRRPRNADGWYALREYVTETGARLVVGVFGDWDAA